MIHAQQTKIVAVTPPGALLDAASATTTEIDTLTWDYCKIICHLGATNTAMTALAVTQADVSGTGHTNVTGLIWGTSANIAGDTSTLPIATNDNGFFIFHINLLGLKRFLDVTATNDSTSTGGYITIFAILSRGDTSPTTAAERGAVEILRV